ncbi:MAG: DUF2182 domain-containing protein [Alphaproteobacteria bacterium]|nr:DUF2182 domain-containing protein [Alphaproteobacteria bacterium]
MALAGWAFVIWSCLHMKAPLVQAMMPRTSAWTLHEAGMVWLMWAVMMAAMMLPSAAPMILVHRRMSLGHQDRGNAENAVFIGAYLVAWSAFSLAAAGAQWGLQSLSITSTMVVMTDPWLAGSVLVAAGLYQLTPLKEACLAHCRTPIGFLATEWRPGNWGAFRMCLKHGTFCIGCCWGLMAVLFVFGVMSLLAIVLLATAVAAEKLLPWGKAVRWALGSLFVVWGAALPQL